MEQVWNIKTIHEVASIDVIRKLKLSLIWIIKDYWRGRVSGRISEINSVCLLNELITHLNGLAE